MLESIFQGVFDTESAAVITVSDFLLCVGCALILGFLISASYQYRTRSTKSFVLTLALLPAVVCVVIMMVNGNVGAGVAVAGAFSLVRFRSAPGTAREICALFLGMGTGLICGMGYLGYAVLFTLVLCAILLLYTRLGSGSGRKESLYKTLHITIPEDLDYPGVFEELLWKYASEWELTSVKTTHMGSLFRLTYDLKLRCADTEKAFIDELRQKNGNLEITISRQETPQATGL